MWPARIEELVVAEVILGTEGLHHDVAAALAGSDEELRQARARVISAAW
jgi:hypothetical protein